MFGGVAWGAEKIESSWEYLFNNFIYDFFADSLSPQSYNCQRARGNTLQPQPASQPASRPNSSSFGDTAKDAYLDSTKVVEKCRNNHVF